MAATQLFFMGNVILDNQLGYLPEWWTPHIDVAVYSNPAVEDYNSTVVFLKQLQYLLKIDQYSEFITAHDSLVHIRM